MKYCVCAIPYVLGDCGSKVCGMDKQLSESNQTKIT